MTNYRFTICETHDIDQFNYCFDCGAPLTRDGNTLVCSNNWVHLRIWLREEPDSEGSECMGVEIE